jgi:hypothetical protein
MTLRQYLLLMGFGSLLAWTAVGVVVTNTDPAGAAPAVFGVVYASAFLALAGTLSLLGFALRAFATDRGGAVSRQASTSFRQGALLAVMLVAALALESRSSLTILTAILLLMGTAFVEVFLISAKVR